MRAGDVVRILRPSTVAGLRAAIVRRSQKTGGLTVKLIDGRGAYQQGDELNVSPCDVGSAMETRS